MRFQSLIIVLLLIIAGGFFTGFYFYHFYRQEKTLNKPAITSSDNFHYSYFSQPGFFDQAYKSAAPESYQPLARAIMVNHHLLASKFIGESFTAVATNAPLTVLLISPNHFASGKGDVITSSETWKTPYGELLPDLQIINQLKKGKLASVEESPFDQEHGVSGIVPFIKKSLPNAKVVPLIFNNRVGLSEAQDLADEYNQTLPPNILIVGSFDFSHYLTSNAADFHDADSLSTIYNFSFGDIYRTDMNSYPGLAFYLELLKDRGYQNFHLLENSNSAKLSREDILETTSYIDGYFSSGQPAASSAATLLALGSVQDSPEVENSLKSFSPTFSIEYLQRLLFGQQKTVARINASSGLPADLKIDGINTPITGNQTILLGDAKLAFINSQRPADLRAAIDSGADVTIGNSQIFKIESYKNKLIFYGQGYFLTNMSLQNKSENLGLGFVASGNSLSIYLLPIGFIQGKGKLLIGADSSTMLVDLANASAVDNSLKQEIKNGKLQLITK